MNKLTDEQIVAIRKLYATGNFTQEQLAKASETSLSTVNRIVRGKTYEDIGGPITKMGSGRRLIDKRK